jgi:hypothetical protein
MRRLRPIHLFAFVVALLVFGGRLALADPRQSAAMEKLRAQIDVVYEQQAEKVDEALHALQPQHPGVRDLYFVGFAGFGNQDVFRKEVERVRDLLDAKYGTAGHSIVLINNPDTLDRYPLATPETLSRTLRGIGKQFDPKEDVLFLFMTSHGLPHRGFVTGLSLYNFGIVTPRSLERTLNAAGIRNRIVFVSSCYSGQFVPALKSRGSLVITASAANRPSFGCETDADWTWFGESYFVDALPQSGKFERAFYAAQKVVTRREHSEHMRPSRPQISMGKEMRKILQEIGH